MTINMSPFFTGVKIFKAISTLFMPLLYTISFQLEVSIDNSGRQIFRDTNKQPSQITIAKLLK